MSKSNQTRRSRLRPSQLERVERDEIKVRIGLKGMFWAGLSLFVVLLTVLLLLLLDGRNVVHAAEKDQPWSAAMLAADWPTVQKLARAAVEKNSQDDAAQHALGLALMEQGKLDEAENPLIAADALAPGLPEYKITEAELYTRKGVPSLAAEKYRSALDLDPSLVDIHWRLARTLYQIRDYDGSLEQLRIINQLQPENWDAYRLTADVAMGRRKYDEAIKNLKLYTAVVPDARAYAKLASAYMLLSPPDTAAARMAAEQSLSIDPGDSQAHLVIARTTLFQLTPKLPQATQAALAGKALEHYTEAAAFFIPARDAYFVSKLNARDPAKAEVALRIAAAIDTTNKDYAFDLASNLMGQRKYDEARQIYQNVIELDPGNPAGYINLGIAERQAGDPDAALKAFQKAAEVDASSCAAYKNMGDVYADKGNNADAVDNYRHAMDLARSGTDRKCGADAGDALGYKLYEMGDYNGAVKALEDALTFDDCHLHAILTLASAYQKLNQPDKVCATMKRAQLCAPADPDVKRAVAGYGCK